MAILPDSGPSLGRGGPLTGLIPGRSEVKRHYPLHNAKKGGDDPPFPLIPMARVTGLPEFVAQADPDLVLLNALVDNLVAGGTGYDIG
jgi:hypothetical protein